MYLLTFPSSILEKIFRLYLRHVVQKHPKPISVQYTAAEQSSYCFIREEKFSNLLPPKDAESLETIRIQVLTPAFYSRFVHYRTMGEAIEAEFLIEPEHNQTAYVSDAALLDLLFNQEEVGRPGRRRMRTGHFALSHSGWNLLYWLRSSPDAPSYPPQLLPSSKAAALRARDSGSIAPANEPTPLDNFVRRHCSGQEQSQYRRAVTRLFLSKRIALGFVPLLNVYRLLICLVVGLLAACATASSMTTTGDRNDQDTAKSIVWTQSAVGSLLCCLGWICLERQFV